jgi:hypothetical protein
LTVAKKLELTCAAESIAGLPRPVMMTLAA